MTCKQCEARKAGYVWHDLLYCKVCKADHAKRHPIKPYGSRDIYGYGQD